MATWQAVKEGAREAQGRLFDLVFSSGTERIKAILDGNPKEIIRTAQIELHGIIHDISLRIAKAEVTGPKETDPYEGMDRLDEESAYASKTANELVEEMVTKPRYVALAPIAKVLAKNYGLRL